eukprot:5430214-Amphidinium_carterae.4
MKWVNFPPLASSGQWQYHDLSKSRVAPHVITPARVVRVANCKSDFLLYLLAHIVARAKIVD